MATKHIIPGRIDDLLKQLGMTQKDFCASTKPHIDPATFKKARDGGPVRHEIAKRIATGFSIPLNTLVATVADGEPSTSDGSTTDHPYVFDEPNIHSGDCSIEPCTLMKPEDAAQIAQCVKIRWRLDLDELSDEQEIALKALQYEIFSLEQAENREVGEDNAEEESLDFQISSIRMTKKTEEILSELKQLKIKVHQMRYQVWNHHGSDEFERWEPIDHAAIVVSEFRKSIRLFQVDIGDPPHDLDFNYVNPF